MKNLKLICMSFDGEYITAAKNNDIEILRDESANMGSRWFFYPFHFICTEKTVKESCYGLEWMAGKRVKTVKRLFNELSQRDDMQSADCDTFVYSL